MTFGLLKLKCMQFQKLYKLFQYLIGLRSNQLEKRLKKQNWKLKLKTNFYAKVKSFILLRCGLLLRHKYHQGTYEDLCCESL